MHPYFHPTTVLVVDDDRDFLDDLGFRFGRDLLFRSFEQPMQALAHIDRSGSSIEGYRKFFSAYMEVIDSPDANLFDRLIAFKPSRICRLVEDGSRFDTLSVIVVDNDMPQMNGIEFCRRISKLPAKKIMLTGVAGENAAINAFNENLIDCFIFKGNSISGDLLLGAIRRLQQEYFGETTASLADALSLHRMEFRDDPAFTRFFTALIEQEGIVEYYISTNPQGFLMVRADGHYKILLVQNDEDLRAHREIAAEVGAPAELLRELTREDILPWFPSPSGYFEDSGMADWRTYLHPVQFSAGPGQYRCSFVDIVSLYPDLRRSVFSLDAHRASLDIRSSA